MSDLIAPSVSPAVAKLLACADAALAIAQECRAAGNDAKTMEAALVAAEYVRAAKAMQAMDDSFAALRARSAP